MSRHPLPDTDGVNARDCLDCGLPISAERLQANPDATRCVRCESERSRTQAKPNPPPE